MSGIILWNAFAADTQIDSDNEKIEHVSIKKEETKNPYAHMIEPALMKRLLPVVEVFSKLEIEDLHKVSNKIEMLKKKYKGTKEVSDMLRYIDHELQNLIRDKTKHSNIDTFFCDLKGECNYKKEPKTDITPITVAWVCWTVHNKTINTKPTYNLCKLWVPQNYQQADQLWSKWELMFTWTCIRNQMESKLCYTYVSQ